MWSENSVVRNLLLYVNNLLMKLVVLAEMISINKTLSDSCLRVSKYI